MVRAAGALAVSNKKMLSKKGVQIPDPNIGQNRSNIIDFHIHIRFLGHGASAPKPRNAICIKPMIFERFWPILGPGIWAQKSLLETPFFAYPKKTVLGGPPNIYRP